MEHSSYKNLRKELYSSPDLNTQFQFLYYKYTEDLIQEIKLNYWEITSLNGIPENYIKPLYLEFYEWWEKLNEVYGDYQISKITFQLNKDQIGLERHLLRERGMAVISEKLFWVKNLLDTLKKEYHKILEELEETEDFTSEGIPKVKSEEYSEIKEILIDLYKKDYLDEMNFEELVVLLTNYINKKEINKNVQIRFSENKRINKKAVGWKIARVHKKYFKETATYEFLKLLKLHISIFKEEKLVEEGFVISSFYKCLTQKTSLI